MRGGCLALVLASVVSIATGSAAAANYAQESLDQYFRIEYQVEPSAARPVAERVLPYPNAAAGLLRAVHRGVGGLNERSRVASGTWEGRDPDREVEALARRGPGPFQVLYRTSGMDAAARWMTDHGLPEPDPEPAATSIPPGPKASTAR